MKIKIDDIGFILRSIPNWNVSIIGNNNIIINDVKNTNNKTYVLGRYNDNNVISYNYNPLSPENPVISYNFPFVSGIASFLVCYNDNGELEWISLIDGTYDEESLSIGIGTDGIYVSGQYNSNNVKVYTGALPHLLSSYETLPEPSLSAAFIVKYSLNGLIEWTTFIDGTNYEYNTNLTVANDNVYISGYYEPDDAKAFFANVASVNNRNNYINLPPVEIYGCFLVKYNKFGEPEWATKIENIHPEQNYILTADNNFVYLIGEYNLSDGTPTGYGFNENGIGLPSNPTVSNSLTSSTGFSIFIIKYGSNGAIYWITSMESYSDLYIKDANCDSSGLYLVGSYNGDSISINSTNGYSIILPSGSVTKSYLVKYNTLGIVQWGFNMSNAPHEFAVNTIKIYNSQIYIGGNFTETSLELLSRNNSRNITINGNGINSSGFLAKYNSDGKIGWGVSFDDPIGSNVSEIDVNNNGIYIIGNYTSTLISNSYNDINTLTYKTNDNQNQSAFIGKYSENFASEIELTDILNSTILIMYSKPINDLFYSYDQGGFINTLYLQYLQPYTPNTKYYFGIAPVGPNALTFFFGAYDGFGYALTNYDTYFETDVPNCAYRINLDLYEYNQGTLSPTGVYARYVENSSTLYYLNLKNNNLYGLYDTGNLRPDGGGGGGIGSDPYVSTYSGKTYKLKDEIKLYLILTDNKGLTIKGQTTGYPEGIFFSKIMISVGKSNININFNKKNVKIINSIENKIEERILSDTNFPFSQIQKGKSTGKKNEKLYFIKYEPCLGLFIYINFKQRYIYPIMNLGTYHKSCKGLLCD